MGNLAFTLFSGRRRRFCMDKLIDIKIKTNQKFVLAYRHHHLQSIPPLSSNIPMAHNPGLRRQVIDIYKGK